MKYFQLLIWMAFLFPALLRGANTYTAANCNQNGTNSLGALIAAASDGDTVNGPAGGGSASWSSPIVSSRTFTVNGNGCSITTSGNDIFHFTWTNSSIIPRITNFTMNGSFGMGGLMIDGNVPAFRIDHITVNQSGPNHWLFVGYNSWATYNTGLYGLVDHITWVGTGSTPAILVYGLNQNWLSPHTMGTSQSIYMEDSSFSCPTCAGPGGSAIDVQHGGKVVFRHNTVLGEAIATHDLGDPLDLGVREKEFYNNTSSCAGSTTGGCFDAIHLRGGTGVDFNNAISIDALGNNGWQTAFFTQIFRSGVNGLIPYGFPVANPDVIPGGGGICSDFVPHYNYPPYAICYSTSDSGCTPNPTNATLCGKAYYDNSITNTLLTQLDGTGSGGYPARDQTGAGPDTGANHVQTGGGEPEYIWNTTNTRNGNAVVYNPVTNNDSPLITFNRDIYQQGSSFDGTSGVGVGLLSARPSTCTAGVGYWATDTNVLYTCNSGGNAWSTHYTPYTYPHPLVNSNLSSPPKPPTNLNITVN
jgi:hypothetical protein